MSSLIRHELDPEGRAWIADRLSWGRPMDRVIRDEVDLAGGRTYTLLPAAAPRARVVDFASSILSTIDARGVDLDGALIGIVLEHLGSAPEACCLFEDPVAEATDTIIRADPEGLHFCEGSVYVFLGSRATPGDIRKALSLVRPAYPPLLGMLTSIRQESELPVQFSVTQLRRLVRQATHILTGAYDGEGFVVWRTADARALRWQCPVCGYPALHEAPRTEVGGGSYEICPSCGYHFGVSDDDGGYDYDAWRRAWIGAGMPWYSQAITPPSEWDPVAQLRRLDATAG
jgi:hypothetical protein